MTQVGRDPTPLARSRFHERKGRPARDAVTTSALVVLGRLPGAVLPFFIAHWFGADSATDGFFLAYAALFFVANILVTAVESTIVPFVAEREKVERPEFVRSVALVGGAAMTILSALALGLFAVVAPRAMPSGLVTQATGFLILGGLLPPLVTMTAVVSGALNAIGAFWLPAISPALRAGTALACGVILEERLGLDAIVIGLVLGETLRLGWTVIAAKNRGLWSFRASIDTAIVRGFLGKVSWYSLGIGWQGANTIINRVVVAPLGAGLISILELAEKLWYAVLTVPSAGVMPVALSYLVGARVSEVPGGLRRAFTRLVLTVFIGSIGITAALYAASAPVVRIVLGSTSLTADQLGGVVDLVRLFALLCPLYLLTAVTERLHVSVKATRSISASGFLRLVANVAVVATLVRPLNVRVVPLAVGVALLAALVYLGYKGIVLLRSAPAARASCRGE
jgi:peptidoglycan biosynthesis protein MviN/MurJ (putative lipid II flippase)